MKIYSPLSGLVVPLEMVPDQAFAQKLVGDGISVDPVDQILKSPVDGVIEFIHPACHALTIKTDNGTDVLIHIGIDTVKMKGEGFKALVKKDQKVKAGDALIEFDLDFVATQAKSLMTQILISNPEGREFNFSVSGGSFVHSGESLFDLTSTSQHQSVASAAAETGPQHTRSFICALPTGMHARPAAALVQVAKKYQTEITMWRKGKSANAKSLVSLLTLEIAANDLFEIKAAGLEGLKALDELTLLIDSGKLEEAQVQVQPEAPQAKPAPAPTSSRADELTGIAAASGLVLGKILQVKRETVQVTEKRQIASVESEVAFLKSTLADVQTELGNLIQGLVKNKNTEQAEIFKAHLEVLQDPEILRSATLKIQDRLSAEYAWQETVNDFKKSLTALKNEVMATRAHDLQDVGQRVLKKLLNINETSDAFLATGSGPYVLVAQNLTPSDMVLIDTKKIKGICTLEGGASSHVAIIARSMGLAYLVAVPENILKLQNDTEVLLDTKNASLRLNLTPEIKAQAQKEIQNIETEQNQNLKSAMLPAVTTDGHTIKVFANVGKKEDAAQALKLGGEGIGLLRSEFLFLHRNTAPTEQEQFEKYQEILSAMQDNNGDKTVIIRTLDVGGDKPLAYMPIPPEENPFLGVRGLRISLRAPEIFRAQLRALIKVKPLSALQIMFPMVTTLSELLDAKKILAEECAKLNVQNVSVGIMIEVPSAALIADILAPHVDFFSIGSNDLTQYTLAIDRGHRDLAAMADGLHPSVLRLIQITCKAANKHKKMVGVCGGIAGDPAAVPLLVGLGVHELSVSVPVIPNIKAQIRNLSFADCEKLAQQALYLSEASEVRQLVEKLI
ncbi:MAG: phosphoenolpyruvate--protein phosphotransferase [Pseudobdellovibrio sp.]